MKSAGHVVALSAGSSPDLERLGYGEEHVNETLMHLARLVFKSGFRLAYGGRIDPDYARSPNPGNVTQALVDAGIAYSARNESLDFSGAPRLHPAPLISFQSWPGARDVTPALEATLIGICEFVKVDPDNAPGWLHDRDPASVDREELRLWTARALTAMRRRIVRGGDGMAGAVLSISLAGKLVDFAGTMPGVAEEYLEARENGTPVIPFAKFGGCAGRIAEYLLGSSFPEPLTFAYHQARPSYQALARAKGLSLPKRFARLKSLLQADRRRLESKTPLIRGVDNAELSGAMESHSDSRLTRFVSSVLQVLRK